MLLTRAWHFAARAHVDQRRKGAAQEPYVNHLAEVAELVATATGGRDAALIAAAVLHDTVEDTAVKRTDIEAAFGAEIAALVAEVTDDKSLAKAERKRLQIETASSKSRRARLVKLADKTSNLRSIARSPPTGWTLARQREYLAWARAVVARLAGTDAWLEARFAEAAADLERALGGA